MRVTKVYADGVRNLKDVTITPYEELNVICGNNAQGKTNLMEVIWMATGLKSFRGTSDRELVAFDGNLARLAVSFHDGEREQTAEITICRNPAGKKVTLNGVVVKSANGLSGGLNAVYFTPDDLSIAKGSPDGRRSYIDQCIAQIKVSYRKVYQRYMKVMAQRNNLLKQISVGTAKPLDLEIWDIQLAQLGSYITVLRKLYAEKLNQSAAAFYSELTDGREDISLEYLSTVFGDRVIDTDYREEPASFYRQRLHDARQNDIRFQNTSLGVHRDDLVIKLNGIPAKEHGSQGQIRSIALCMKLAQAKILNEELEKMPVMLLDDVLSELDPMRQEFILGKIKDMQVFITCCDPVEKLGRNIFKINGGRVVE